MTTRLGILLAAGGLLAACGREERAEENATGKETATVEESEAGTIDPTAEGHCLADCTTDAGARFSFQRETLLTGVDCSVDKIEVYDAGAGLTTFFVGNCGAKAQVYAISSGYDGTAASQPQLVSSVCVKAPGSVVDFAAAKGGSNFMVSFACDGGFGKATAYVVPVDGKGAAGTAQAIETIGLSTATGGGYYLPSSYSRKIAWNATSATYGLVRAGSMQRLDADGRAVGGSITTAISGYYSTAGITKVLVKQGSWTILRGGSTVSYAGEVRCSKVDALGIPQCNDKVVNSVRSELTADNRLLGIEADGSLGVAPFDAATCTTGTYARFGTLRDAVEQTFGIADLSSTYGAMLYFSKEKALKVAVYKSGSAYGIASELSVTNAQSVTSAQIQTLKGRIYVSYVKDGRGMLAISEQTIAP